MDIHDLNVFATTARHGSITRAAPALSTVQSNVTARIRHLEAELGVQLFHRTHRGVTLTAKGEQLLSYAQQMLSLAEHARAAVSDAGSVAGTLRIGSLQSTAAARLPEVIKAYAATYDQVDITVETGTTNELIDKVLASRLDGAFVAGAEHHPDLNGVTGFVEELVMLTPSRYKSVRAYLDNVPIPKLLVFRVGCHYRQRLERYVTDERIGVLHQMEFGTLDGIVGCVAAGLGISMLPRSVVERAVKRREIAIHRMPKAYRHVETQFVTHRAQIRSLALARLIEVIVEQHKRLRAR